ncbi:MAG: magnesium and cobalt transport protein CorA [Actinomycetales bacterium]|nr:magnesium and cobalt transport protein CorA [Actinomycetales bacterium]
MIRDLAVYRHGIRHDVSDLAHAWRSVVDDGGFLWLGLVEPTDSEMAEAAHVLGLHPLSVEDALHAHQRPKLERLGDTLVCVFKTVFYDDATSGIETGEVIVVCSPRFAVTVRHGIGAQLADTRAGLEARPEFLAHGPYAVLHAVLDTIVDDYVVIAGELEQDIAEIEHRVFSDDATSDAEDIYLLKREVIEFRRAVKPLGQAIDAIFTGDVPGLDPALVPFFRDVDDHVERVADMVDGFDELLTGVLQADLAQIQVRQNADMRRITAWVGIAAVPTMVAGVYGMNFDHMPELHSRYGYAVVMGALLFTCSMLWRRFRKAGWL